MRNRMIILAASCLTLAACDKLSSNVSKQPQGSDGTQSPHEKAIALIDTSKLDLSTPDLAIVAFTKWRNAQEEANCYGKTYDETSTDLTSYEKFDTSKSKAFLSFFAGQALDGQIAYRNADHQAAECLKHRDQWSVDIKEVKMETPSRAIVMASIKNIAPMPDGRQLEEWQKNG